MQNLNNLQIFPVQNVSSVNLSPKADGGTLFVRVISANSDGSFLISAGGHRMNVGASIPLSAGDTFVAMVKVDPSGKVLLSPVQEKGMDQTQQATEYPGFSYGNEISSGALAFRILQFMEQSGMKISASIMDRAAKIGKKFKGKEKLASEAAAILIQKGINPSDENILALMSMSVGDYSGGEKKKGDQQSPGPEKTFLDKIYPSGTGGGEGLLTFMNHVSKGKRHWIFLPYEWKSPVGEASGMMRILLDLESRDAEKILLNCEMNSTKLFFVLYCSKSKGKEVRFFTLPPLLPSKIKAEEMRLGGFLCSGMNMGGPVTVTYSDSACSDGLCTVDELPSMVETLA